MVETGGGAGLSKKPLPQVRRIERLGTGDLDGDLTLQYRVVSEEDDAMAPSAEFPDQVEPAEPRARNRRGRGVPEPPKPFRHVKHAFEAFERCRVEPFANLVPAAFILSRFIEGREPLGQVLFQIIRVWIARRRHGQPPTRLAASRPRETTTSSPNPSTDS